MQLARIGYKGTNYLCSYKIFFNLLKLLKLEIMEYKIEWRSKGAGLSVTQFVNVPNERRAISTASLNYSDYFKMGMNIATVCKWINKKWTEIWRKEIPIEND